MNPNTYIVRPADTLQYIAAAYTGNPERWRELVRANPQWRLVQWRTPHGYELMPAKLKDRSVIFLPMSWPRMPRIALAPISMARSGMFASGMVGQTAGASCSADSYGSPILDVKPYVYQTSTAMFPWALAQKWTGDGNRWKELARANTELDFAYTVPASGTPYCNFKEWGGGTKIKVPADWPDPPAGSDLAHGIVPTGGTGTPGPSTPGPTGNTDITKTGATTGGGIGGLFESIPTWALVSGAVVLGGAVVAGGYYIIKHRKEAAKPAGAPPSDRRQQEARIAAARLQPPAPMRG